MGIDTKERKVTKCDYCDGDPQCVSFCEMKAIDYLDADKANLKKKRDAVLKFSSLMSRYVAAV